MRVLIVEDDNKTASFIRKALQAEDFAVDVSSCLWGEYPIAGRVEMCEKLSTNCASERRRGAGLCCRAAANLVAALFLRPAQNKSFAIARRRSSIRKGLSRMASTGLSDSRSLSA